MAPQRRAFIIFFMCWVWLPITVSSVAMLYWMNEIIFEPPVRTSIGKLRINQEPEDARRASSKLAAAIIMSDAFFENALRTGKDKLNLLEVSRANITTIPSADARTLTIQCDTFHPTLGRIMIDDLLDQLFRLQDKSARQSKPVLPPGVVTVEERGSASVEDEPDVLPVFFKGGIILFGGFAALLAASCGWAAKTPPILPQAVDPVPS